MSNCSTCANCDMMPCLGPGQREGDHGWCAPRSVYTPHPTRTVHPRGSRGTGGVAKPYVINLVDGEPGCALYTPGIPRRPKVKEKSE